jgi:hypothetical protein
MLNEILPFNFELDTVMLAGACLWSLALYLSLSSAKDWITEQLDRWFNFAERSLYTSVEEFEKTRLARESQNAFYASVFSIIPFLGMGILCNWFIEIGLGSSWSISMGILTCMACSIYQLGRRDSQ